MKNLLENLDNLYHVEKADKELIKKALTSKGNRKGLLLKNAPNSIDKPLDNAVWNALISNIAPVRAQISNLMFMSKEHKSVYDRIAKLFTAGGRNYHILNTYGQLPYEFNLYANRYDLATMENIIIKDIEKNGV